MRRFFEESDIMKKSYKKGIDQNNQEGKFIEFIESVKKEYIASKTLLNMKRLKYVNFRNRKISLYLWSWRANLQIKYESYKTVLLRDPAGQKGCNKTKTKMTRLCG